MQDTGTVQITWDDPLTMANVAEHKGALEAALETGPSALSITVASAQDYLARQLIAALRLSAQDAGIALTVTCAQGDWDAMSFKEQIS